MKRQHVVRQKSPHSHAEAGAEHLLLPRPYAPQVCKDIRAVLQKQVDSGKEIQVLQALKTTTITRGLKYSLATGNWGQQGTQGIRAGVSQVRILASEVLPLSHT